MLLPLTLTLAFASSAAALPNVDGQVSGADELLRVARDQASEGKSFYVRAGDYGGLDFRGIRRSRLVTFIAHPGEQPRFGYTVFAESANLRFEGIHFADEIDIQPGPSRRLEFVGNDIGGYTGLGINIREGAEDVLIRNNHIHDLAQRGSGPNAGMGIRVSGAYGPVTNLRIIGNTITRTSNDGMELGGMAGGLIERNDVSRVFPERGSGEHADPFFLWAGSRGVTVRRNRFHDNEQPVYLGPNTHDVIFENNLVVKTENWCIQAGLLGHPGGDAGIHGYRIRNNTLWDCGFGGLLVRGRGSGNVVTNNILQSLEGERLEDQFAVEDHNLIRKGHRRGRHDLAGAPRFVDAGRLDYRLAAGSRGIDAGTSSDAPRRDLLGVRRADDPRTRNRGAGSLPFYDIGAYERFVRPTVRRVSVTRGRGISCRYRMSVPARVVVTLQRRSRGRYRTVRRKATEGRRGRNVTRLSTRRVRGGRYRVVVRAVDRAGNRSNVERVSFRVARR